MEFSLSGCVDETCQLEVETGKTLMTNSKKYDSLEAMLDDSRQFVFNFFNDSKNLYTAGQKEVQDLCYNELLEGYYPDRFRAWLEENDYTDKYIAGDGYIKSEYIKEYKREELGMRFTVSPEVGYTAMPQTSGLGHNVRASALFSFQPNIHFGLGAMIGLDFSIPGGYVYNLNIGPYVIYGNKMDGFAIGGGVAFQTYNMLLELSAILFYKGLSFKIYGSRFQSPLIGISIGYSML